MIGTEKSAVDVIHQCDVCLRYFDAEKRLLDARFIVCTPEIFVCGLDDCGEVKARRERAEKVKREFKNQDRMNRMNRISGEKGCRKKILHNSGNSVANGFRSSCPVDTEPMESFEVAVPAADGRYGELVVPSQKDFEERGAGEKQDAILIEFFSDPKTHGKLWPMVYLEEISGARRMNNRAISLRKHFEPLGFGIWNEMRPYGPTGALHSHYGIFPLAEVERRERERDDRREAERLKRSGQRIF